MEIFKKKIQESFNVSIKNYEQNYKSYHWKYQIGKKKNLFDTSNLKNFRSNNLSNGLDDQFYSKNETNFLFSTLVKEFGEEFISQMLDNLNIGNVNDCYKFKDKYYSSNELFHIFHLARIKKQFDFSNLNIVCEIGPGYGSFISKLLKLCNTKVILIDLPESNFLSSYYLKSLFPNKKFFLSNDIKDKITKENIYKNDIIIICPWDKLPEIKIDFFINSRSMMEMNKETISYYFQFIKKFLSKNGYFLCINRYYKDTVGYPIELYNYPFDNSWKVIISEESWYQNHIHFLFLRRINDNSGDMLQEIKKIKKITKRKIKNDPRLIRRVIPDFLYKTYKKIKFLILKK